MNWYFEGYTVKVSDQKILAGRAIEEMIVKLEFNEYQMHIGLTKNTIDKV